MNNGKVVRLNENCLKYCDEIRDLLPRFLRSNVSFLKIKDSNIIEEALRSYIDMINFDLKERGE